jgi:hypothetical protein
MSGLPHVAVITMARDEGTMLRRWVDHYSREVGVDNLVVVDDNSSDGSTDDLPCTVLRIPPLTSKKSFEPARMGMLGGLSAGLLEAYDAAIFCDVDEFIVADPKVHESLRHFVAAREGRPALGVMGLNVVHDVAREAPLVDGEPILGQRRLAKFLPLMCKPSLKWDPAPWALASHGIKCPFEVDPELFMFHMKFADRDHLEAVADRRHAMFTSEGRAARTSWERSGGDMVDLLDEITADIDLDEVKPFGPPLKKLATIVEQSAPDVWRAVGGGQVQAMRNRPFARIPDRFIGRV